MRAGGIAVIALATACGIEHNGTLVAPDASSADATGDAAADAGDAGCTTALCMGVCVPSCAGCNAGEALCPETRVCGRCGADCVARELECFTCPDGGGPQVFCSSPGSKCSETPERCPCTGGIESCPGQSQVCKSNECRTCGEDGTDGETCASGTCSVKAGVPVCR